MKPKAEPKIMTPKDPNWNKFAYLLESPEGCNFEEFSNHNRGWKCKGTFDLSRNILKKYFPSYNIKETIKYFSENGACCDCEVLFNIDPDDD